VNPNVQAKIDFLVNLTDQLIDFAFQKTD